jgi:hypothetical protein
MRWAMRLDSASAEVRLQPPNKRKISKDFNISSYCGREPHWPAKSLMIREFYTSN